MLLSSQQQRATARRRRPADLAACSQLSCMLRQVSRFPQAQQPHAAAQASLETVKASGLMATGGLRPPAMSSALSPSLWSSCIHAAVRPRRQAESISTISAALCAVSELQKPALSGDCIGGAGQQ